MKNCIAFFLCCYPLFTVKTPPKTVSPTSVNNNSILLITQVQGHEITLDSLLQYISQPYWLYLQNISKVWLQFTTSATSTSPKPPLSPTWIIYSGLQPGLPASTPFLSVLLWSRSCHSSIILRVKVRDLNVVPICYLTSPTTCLWLIPFQSPR